MTDIKFKNKIRGKPLEHVVSLCQAIVIGTEIQKETKSIDINLEGAPDYPVEISHIQVSKVVYQKSDVPKIQENSELLVFPAALPKHVDQFKQYYEKRVKKSCIYESYTCEKESDKERFFFINFTCFGWCFVCLNASEGKSKQTSVVAQIRGCFADFNG